MAEATKIKTKSGAIDFRASTNTFPKKPMNDHCGTVIPKTTPKIIPIMIFKIRLDSVHF